MTRTVLITGAAGALGRALTYHFTELGWRVAGVVRGAADELPSDVEQVLADLSTWAGVDLVGNALPHPPDLLVHAAATYPARGSELSNAELGDVIHVNALAPYQISQRMLDRLAPGAGMTIVCLGSEAMFHADARSGPYGASKAALRVLSSALAARARGTASAVAMLTLGPLATPAREAELATLAERHGHNRDALATVLLARSNPDLVIDSFLPLESCCRAIEHLHSAGRSANGAHYRLDGGSAGSLI